MEARESSARHRTYRSNYPTGTENRNAIGELSPAGILATFIQHDPTAPFLPAFAIERSTRGQSINKLTRHLSRGEMFRVGKRMRSSSDRDKRLRGALDAVDDAAFGISPGASPKDKFDVDSAEGQIRAIDLKALNQRFEQLDEYYSRAVAEIKASLRE